MPGSGTRTFFEADDYEASLRQKLIDTVVTPCGRCKGRLIWADLHQLLLVRCEEDLPRIAYLSLAPRRVFITFGAGSGHLPMCRGAQLQAGEIILHSPGERLHQTTSGPAVWNVIAMEPAQLENYGRALSGKPFVLPSAGSVARPALRDASRLARLHAQACRLAETKPKILAHPEVARGIEQGLIHALVTCLATPRIQPYAPAKRHHARTMVQLEEVLAEDLGRPLHMAELCDLIGVTDRALRSCCVEFLGISPSRYVLLRRLKEVRIALRAADPHKGDFAALARERGFTDLGRFVTAYQEVFGESPSTTLYRAQGVGSANR
jgi:AraC-like DNA-binding protein